MKHMRTLLGVGLVAALTVAYAFTPMTYSPDAVQIDTAKGERCSKEPGKLKCRWDGGCTQIGNMCMSCQKGAEYSTELGKCYTCPQGMRLKQVNGSWECS